MSAGRVKDHYNNRNGGGTTMGKIKLATMILSALSAVLAAAKSIVSFIKCMVELRKLQYA